MSIGILHGANDIKMIKNTIKGENQFSFKSILSIYILVVLLTALSFFVLPALALMIFVLLSSYHFGEQHWASSLNISKPLGLFFYFLYGSLIFNLLFYLNSQDTINVIYSLTGYLVNECLFLVLLFTSVILAMVILIYFYVKDWVNINIGEEVFLIVLFFIVFKIASLIWAFSIYFIFWHSLPSLRDQINILYGDYSKKNLLRYVKSSILYWLLAILGLGVVLYIFRSDETLFLSLFFAFLAAITVPHVFVMHKVLKKL